MNCTDKKYAFLVAENITDDDPAGFKVVLKDYQWSGSDQDICMGEVLVDFEVEDLTPDEMRQKLIDSMNDKIMNVRAEAYKREQQLKEKIDKLLTLEYINVNTSNND